MEQFTLSNLLRDVFEAYEAGISVFKIFKPKISKNAPHEKIDRYNIFYDRPVKVEHFGNFFDPGSELFKMFVQFLAIESIFTDDAPVFHEQGRAFVFG